MAKPKCAVDGCVARNAICGYSVVNNYSECGALDKHRCKHKQPLVAAEHHIHCHDCGQFLKKGKWVRKDHPKYHWAICSSCLSNYDDPLCY